MNIYGILTSQQLLQPISKVYLATTPPQRCASVSSFQTDPLGYSYRRGHLALHKIRLISTMESQTRAPNWTCPSPASVPALKLYNSLTRKKEIFLPHNGNHIQWYNCGPTVYDAAHVGHARLYTSIDVMRRILEDYFGYHVHFVMNITDIDDKIILRARQTHLFNQFKKKHVDSGLGLTDTIRKDLSQFWQEYVIEFFGDNAKHNWENFYQESSKIVTGNHVDDFKKGIKLSNAVSLFCCPTIMACKGF
jgi:cysteinyl-tRNA synthetase